MARTRDGPSTVRSAQNRMAEPRTNAGHFTTERAREAARKRWEKPSDADGRSGNDADAQNGIGSPNGSAKPSEERDRALALKEARRMLKDGTTPAAVKAQLIRTLAGVEEQQAAATAPELEALDGLSEQQLEALVLAHC